MKRQTVLIALALVGALLLGSLLTLLVVRRDNSPTIAVEEKKDVYTCPMHPSIISDKPGKCPICHMDLQKVDREATKKADRKILYYRHPMKGEITSPTPAKDEMGMDYIPVYEDEAGTKSEIEGRAGFTLSPQRQQLIGVTSAKAELKPFRYEVRASGKVAFDPELFTAIEEYRQSLLSASQMKESPYESLRGQANEMVTSSKTKLRLLGLSDAQINRLATTNVPAMTLLLPKGSAWVYAEIFEYEMAGIKEGQAVEMTTPSQPGRTFSGKLTSVSPVLNPQTRTFRVRALVPDPKGELKPDTYVNVKIQVELGEKLTVPASSVLHSGEEAFVFVMKEQGRFEPRKVSVGAKAQDSVEIVSGLAPGEVVVTSANFLIDSESRLRGVLESMKSPPGSTK